MEKSEVFQHDVKNTSGASLIDIDVKTQEFISQISHYYCKQL